jgi:hypothetical protein
MSEFEQIRAESSECACRGAVNAMEMLKLQRAALAALLLASMHAKIDNLCAQRKRLKKNLAG